MKSSKKSYTTDEVNALIKRFERQLLPKVEWTHKAHLVVAIWYVYHHGFEKALPLVRRLIWSHNAAVGTPNTDQEGYHESITRFWLLVAKDFIGKKEDSVYELSTAFIDTPLSASDYPLTFFSASRLFSVKARREWVEPDLKTIGQRHID